MEMTLTVHVPRRRPHPVDVVVAWSGRSTAADLCAALAEHLGEPVASLSSRGRPVPAEALVGMPPLLHGASVAVADRSSPAMAGGRESRAVLDLVVVGGPDAGRSHPLSPPGVAVGRAPAAGLVVDDDALSRTHLVVAVGPLGVTVEDRGSTNGVTVDGRRLDSAAGIDSRSTVVAGASTLRLRRPGGPCTQEQHPGDGTVRISVAASPSQGHDDVEIDCPAAPLERSRARVPWVTALAPVPVAVALAFVLGPQLLLFAALGPVSLLAGTLGDRWGSGRAHRRELATHTAAVEGAHARLADALRSEQERLDRAHPDPAAVLATAEQRLAGLWRGGGSARVRLGLGDVPTRVTWVEGSTRTHPPATRAPLVVDLTEVRCLGVVGALRTTNGVLSGLLGQLCTTNAPHDLTVSVASSGPQWSWATRVPHATDVATLTRLGTGAPGRWAEAAGGHERREPLRVLVVPHPGPGTDALVGAALEAGVLVVAAATSPAELPSGCHAVVRRVGRDHVVAGPAGQVPFVPDLVGAWWADRVSRALAPLRSADPTPGGRMPARVTLADALGGAELTAARVADGWRARAGAGDGVPSEVPPPTAVVGWGPDGPFRVDLGRDGPHVLVGGTTGSGKSEFLRTLVTSLAISAPPEDLTFVLVDFKGGAAFGPCAALPHVVGLVTDLDDHLVSRALASLRAELRRRERLLAAVGASDLAAYQRLRAAGSEPVPRLVVVVDELRALVEELPDFVTGLVRLAALGRSLGVHLVLATQRPSGAVSAEVQANVSLRIAFRVRDRADSVDVLDDAAAAGIAPSTPGRAMARGADGSLVTFQAATVAEPRVREVAGLRVRPAPADGDPVRGPLTADEDEWGAGPGLAEAVCEAHRLLAGHPPRTPWLAPLPAVVPAVVSGRQPSTDIPRRVGLVDEPDLQRVSALAWEAGDGSWLLAGGSGSGRTTALRALALAAAARWGPSALHLHVIDAHGSLADLRALPHLGTSARADNHRACAALVRHLREEVDRRLGAHAGSSPATSSPWPPTTMVLVDGWEQLVEAQPPHSPDQLTAELLRVLRDGRSVGVVAAVSGGRSLLHPRWGAVGGPTFLLGSIDPLDAALAGLRTSDLPRDPPPGRAVRVPDTREVQFAMATSDDTSAVARDAEPRPEVGSAWRHVALPAVVHRSDLPRELRPESGAVGSPDDVLLGIGGDDGSACCWRPSVDGRRLLVVGPQRSGRTNALRVVAHSLRAAGRPVVVVGAAAGAGRLPWPDGSVTLGSGDADSLVRLRRRHPGLAVCVDDADRLGDSDLVPVLREIIELVERDDGLAVVSTSATALSTRFSGIDVELARHGCGLVLNPTPADRGLLATALPPGIPRQPGRGVLVRDGQVTEVQVLLGDGSLGGVAPGEHLGLGVTGHPGRHDHHERHHDDDPADDRPVALDQADSDRQQDRVPDQGRSAGPRRGTEPTTRQGAEADGGDEDQHGRHQHASGVAALTEHELDDVVDGEAGQGERLQPGEQRDEAAGAA